MHAALHGTAGRDRGRRRNLRRRLLLKRTKTLAALPGEEEAAGTGSSEGGLQLAASLELAAFEAHPTEGLRAAELQAT